MPTPRQTNQEISGLVRSYDIKYGLAIKPFLDWFIEQLKNLRNRTIKQVVDRGWKLFDVEAKLKQALVDTAAEGGALKIKAMNPSAEINTNGLKSDVKNKPWVDDGRDLNSRAQVADTATRRYIVEATKQDFAFASDYERNLKAINAQIRASGQVDEKLLRKRVRKMTADIRKLGFTKDYEKQLKLLEKEISTLSEMNYPTSETKKAYEGFIRAVRGKNIQAFEKSVEQMVKTKARYITRRIARTETARAQLDSFLLMSKDDEDVIGYVWNLDASHKITDICDVHAKGNFGLGVGVFPKDKLPPIPAHPSCICYLTEVIIDDENPVDLDKFNYTKGGNALINKLPAKQQNVILGSKERGKAFRKGESWDKAIVGEPVPQDIQTRFDNVIESKYL